MTGINETVAPELLVAAILVGVAVLVALGALASDEEHWISRRYGRRYANTLFFAWLFAVWAVASLVIVVMRDML